MIRFFQKGNIEKTLLGLAFVLLVSTILYQFVSHQNTIDSEVTNPINKEAPKNIAVAPSTPASIDMIVANQELAAQEKKQPVEKKISHIISKGETIQSILLSLGMTQDVVSRAIKELQKVYNPKALKIGQELRFHYKTGVDNQPAALISVDFKTTGGHDICLAQHDNTFIAKKREIKLTKVVHRVSGNINSSFYSAALKKGVPASVVKEAISALSYDVNWQHDPKQGDPYSISFEAFVDDDGKIVNVGELKFAAFAPKQGNWRKIYAFKTPNGTGYYNEKGESVVRSLLQTPVDPTKMRVTSKFGNRRHPIHGYTKFHKGVDFGAPHGTPVSSAGDGVVVKAGWNGSYGNYVLIKHNNEYATAYGHLSKIKVKPGQRVKQRQSIGNVGTTGSSTGPHLHYEVIVKGKQVNPQSIKQMPSTKLISKDMARFKQVKLEADQGLTKNPVHAVSNSTIIAPVATPVLQVAAAKSLVQLG